MVVLVLQKSDGEAGVDIAASAYDRALKHARDICETTILERGARSGMLGVQQPPGCGARAPAQEAQKPMVVQNLHEGT